MEIKQYHIVLVNLDPTVGSEIRKTRPCVIISPDVMNRHLRTIVLAPMTTQSREYPTRIKIKMSERTSWVVLDQIWTVDKQRIIKHLDSLSDLEIQRLKEIFKETFID